ncbi:hypothetical protein QBC40DRAFT_233635 [Triangularia verruculosa]|uniref:Rhodopsin domain-containing protein n=1 Tax=Triangularia verruculosa TaxID=2587418 RepID=A0AAN7ATA4_9PEZI|nr:hypothetical protein QBC40DRAFT_233635 [Triangularia verruculosa]
MDSLREMNPPAATTPKQRFDDYSPILNFAIWVLAGYATIFISLRLWGKYHRGRRLWWDDYILVASWMALILGCIFQTVDTTLGFGRSHHGIYPENLETTRLLSTVAGFFLILAAAWSKTSFAATLLRLAETEEWLKKLVWFAIWTTNICIAGSCIIQWAHCWPLDRIWRQEVPGGKCMPISLMNGYNMFVAAYSGLMDIMLALLPCKLFWPLMMKRKEKIGITIAMGMGVFAGAASFMKILAIHSVNRPNAGPGMNTPKVGPNTANISSEHVVVLMVLGTAESAITIVAVCMPVLRTLLMRESDHMLKSSLLSRIP